MAQTRDMVKHKAYMTAWRSRNRDRMRSHWAVAYDTKLGRIKYKGVCIVCGDRRYTEMHHRDPKKKRDVFELCVPCHRRADYGRLVLGYVWELV